MTLHATEFIRRFLLHVLPKGLDSVTLSSLWHNESFRRRANNRLPFCSAAGELGLCNLVGRGFVTSAFSPIAAGPVCRVGLKPIECFLPRAPAVARHLGRLIVGG
jgi:hypothetical protein